MNVKLLILLAAALSGCKDGDATLPAPLEAVLDRAKSAVTGERLPEKSSESAVTNHGLVKLQEWADGGDSKAQHFVAVAYLVGNGVPKNFGAAEKWALRSANQGFAPAQFLVGLFRKDGATSNNLLAVEPNLVRAYIWLSLAAAQGHPQARKELDRIQTAMDSAWVSRAQAIAADWRQCTDRACQDREPDPGPSSNCTSGSTSVMSLLCP